MKIKIPDIMISRLFDFEWVERRSNESEIDICGAHECIYVVTYVAWLCSVIMEEIYSLAVRLGPLEARGERSWMGIPP